jgi:hypothetical protein
MKGRREGAAQTGSHDPPAVPIGAAVTVTIEIQAILPGGASDQLVRTVTENSRTLRFKSHGFEVE